MTIAEFNDWLTATSRRAGVFQHVAVLAIREFRDNGGALHGFILERRQRTAEGEYYGNPARVEVTGSALQVTAYKATAGGGLLQIGPRRELPIDRPSRARLFIGEDRAIRTAYGAPAHIVAAREPSSLEELIGFSRIVHLLTEDGREVACGIGWHGTTPFLIEGDFAASDGLVFDAIAKERAANWRELLTANQAVWLRYAERYEDLIILEVRPEGMTNDVLVLTGDAGGTTAWHLIDGDGVELWRKTPEELIATTPRGVHMPVPGTEANDQPYPATGDAERARRA